MSKNYKYILFKTSYEKRVTHFDNLNCKLVFHWLAGIQLTLWVVYLKDICMLQHEIGLNILELSK